MRLGFWPPVYGNWIMTDDPEEGIGSYDYVKDTALLADRCGFDTLLLAEHLYTQMVKNWILSMPGLLQRHLLL